MTDDRSLPTTRCPKCLDGDPDLDRARACLQLPTFSTPGAFDEFRQRHGLRRVGGRGGEVDDRPEVAYVAPDGLTFVFDGDPEVDGAASYLNLWGPAAAAERAYRDLLESAEYVKRELRTLALVEDIPDDHTEPVPEPHRLAPQAFADEHVPDADEGGDLDAGAGAGGGEGVDDEGEADREAAPTDLDYTPVELPGADEVVPLAAIAADTVRELPDGARYGPGLVVDAPGGDRA